VVVSECQAGQILELTELKEWLSGKPGSAGNNSARTYKVE